MEVQVIIVCDRYGDFLNHTLPATKKIFSKIAVVTSWEDQETLNICAREDVEAIPTDAIRDGGFNKSVAIDSALRQLRPKGWVLQLDADIWLPPWTRFSEVNFYPNMIYGIDRVEIRGLHKWRAFKRNYFKHPSFLHFWETPTGRVDHEKYGGWIPIGFFQLWNIRGSGVYHYHVNPRGDFCEDALFAMNWRRRDRCLIPDVLGIHLVSYDAWYKMDWKGRRSARFE